VGFFEALNKVLSNPETHHDLLELLHACLSLGFEGQYRVGGQRANLERVRQDVYETLRYFKERPGAELSPHWRGLSEASADRSWRLPLWAIAAAAIAVVAGAFSRCGYLSPRRARRRRRSFSLNPATPVTIERANYEPVKEEAPKPVTTQIERIRAALAQDMQAGNLTVQQKGDFILIEINNALLFESGSADIKAAFEPIAARIAAALDAERGPIRIVGHTDNVRPRKSGPFKSNYDLSVARAKSVESIVAPGIGNAPALPWTARARTAYRRQFDAGRAQQESPGGSDDPTGGDAVTNGAAAC
jgi:type VI secretion system protein ImpK